MAQGTPLVGGGEHLEAGFVQGRAEAAARRFIRVEEKN